ncbi:MAG: sensor histidine kinase [Candidatus Azotimanducaceae bacterium]
MSENAFEKAYQREKAARLEAERLLEDLSRQIYAKNEELETLYQDLKANQSLLVQREKLASVGELASGVAHEINNPVGFCLTNLNTLESYLPILIQACAAGVDHTDELVQSESTYILEDLPILIQETSDGLRSIQSIVKDLRNYSRDNQEDDFTSVDINLGIQSTLNVLRSQIDQRYNVHLALDELPLVLCNPGKLNQVFANLITNALQAMANGGNLYIDSGCDDHWVWIRFSDDGPGIAEAVEGQIFQPFFTTKAVGDGTGLGLSICYTIITELHRGMITPVSDGRGKGATFEVKIPTAEC